MTTHIDNITALYQRATLLHQQKQLAPAWEAYQQVLQTNDQHLLSLLGISRLLYQQQKFNDAIPYLERLLLLRPLVFEGRYMLGVSYAKIKDNRAKNTLRKALHLTQAKTVQQSETLYQLAKILRDQAETEAAEKLVDRILEHAPEHPKALSLKGQFQQQREEQQAAFDTFKIVVQQLPSNAKAHYNFGCQARVLKKNTLAQKHLEQAIQLQPNWDAPLRELALVLSQLGQPLQAQQLLKKAVQIAPQQVENYRSVAQWYAANGDRRKAIKWFSKVVEMQPEDMIARKELSTMLTLVGAYPAAIPHFQKLMEDKPDAESLTNLATTYIVNSQLSAAQPLLQRALNLDPKYSQAVFQAITLRAKLCDWNERAADSEAWQNTALHVMKNDSDEKVNSVNIPLLDMSYYNLPLSIHRQLNQFSAQAAAKRAKYINQQFDFVHPVRQHERLRIGYLSPDFRHHPVGRIVQHLFKAHHRERVEIYAYSLSEAPATDSVRQAIKAGVDHFHELAYAANATVAQQIYADEIDVLIDLGGYTAFARPEIAAARPAPVQAHFLGYPNTSGADYYDYLLADDYLIAPAFEEVCTETVYRLPHAFPGAIPQVSLPQTDRAAEGIAEDAFVFAAFNRPEKYEPQMFATWLDIVNAVPNGVLWIGVSSEVQANLEKFATDHWLDISQVKFSDWADYPTFLHRLRLADLFLDTLYYSAGATAVASIAMGTPVLTVTQDNFTSRLAATVVAGAQQQELICPDLTSFKTKAIALANDPAKMKQLKQQLTEQPEQLPLFDMDRFATSLEDAYGEMYQRYKAAS